MYVKDVDSEAKLIEIDLAEARFFCNLIENYSISEIQGTVSKWAAVEFSHLNVEDVESVAKLFEFDLAEANFFSI